MASLIIQVIEEVGPERVVHIVSDHAKNLQAALTIVKNHYPWITASGCKAHLAHLACSDILKLDETSELMDICKDMSRFFSYSLYNL